MSEKKRVTLHYSKQGSAIHNGRNFNLENDDHIDKNRTADNWTWHCYQKSNQALTLDEAEQEFYERNFSEDLSARNQKAITARHRERVKTMKDYRHSRNTKPDECLIYLGDKDNHVSASLLKKIVVEQVKWERKMFPNVETLSVALHCDEQGAPHIHKRTVYVATNSQGHKTVNQSRCLKQMGIERPDMSKPESKYNNSKMTYTRMCREHLQELCRERGIDIETEPREKSKSGRKLYDYQAEQAKQREAESLYNLANLEREASRVDKSMAEGLKRLKTQNTALQTLSRQTDIVRQELNNVLALKEQASEIHKIFGDKKTVTYNQHMASELKDIGNKVERQLKSIESARLDLDKRERKLNSDELQTKRNLEQAKRLRGDAEQMRDDVERYIDKQAQERLDSFLRDEPISGSRQERLEEFCKTYRIGNKSLLDLFESRERGRNITVNRRFRDYNRNRDMEHSR